MADKVGAYNDRVAGQVPAKYKDMGDGTWSLRSAVVNPDGSVIGSGGTGLTDAQLRATPVPVSGTFWQATQPVSGTFWQATQPVSGTFFQATQPVSLATNTPDVTDRAARLLGIVYGALGQLAQKAASTLAVATDVALVVQDSPQDARAATLAVTGTAAAGTGVTVTLPAPAAGLFHYITRINIVKYASVATVGAAAPTVVTSTNLAGSLAWTLPTALAVGTQYETDVEPASPIKSAVAATATTIVAAALASIIYRITVYYYTAP